MVLLLTRPLTILIMAYLIGSIPTAVLVARTMLSADIREIGDGNMGARNVAHTLGWGPGALVATIDFSKGAVAVLLARAFDLPPIWQLAAGACSVLGHDFPIFAGFRGGQGLAATLGSLFVLMPQETFWGLACFGGGYLLTRSFDLSAGFGLALLAFLGLYLREPVLLLGYTVGLFLLVPIKKALDWPLRRRLARTVVDLTSQAPEQQADDIGYASSQAADQEHLQATLPGIALGDEHLGGTQRKQGQG